MLKELAKRWHYLAVSPHEAEFEKKQCIDEGRDFSSVADDYEKIIRQDLLEPEVQAAMQAMLDRTIRLPMRPGFEYVEPSDLDAIRRERSTGPALPTIKLTQERLREKLHGAWLGRCCGCLLGKPVEGQIRSCQAGYLKETGQWPLSSYVRWYPEIEKKYEWFVASVMINNISGSMPTDDDTNYTVMGLNILKQFGRDFRPVDVATYWMYNVPILNTCTAERIAYRNFANLLVPPESAIYRNIYREWIGAQIRADIYGYVCPGNPERAAEFAWRDASISHVKNGIYGAMWVAAMLAASFVTDDMVVVLEAGLAQIPARSRLAAAIRRVIEWYRSGIGDEEAQERIHREWDEKVAYSWVHTISNAMIVAMALLWGQGDYGRTICLAVQAAMDTDCNGATAGSIAGAILGAGGIPAQWRDPICDTMQTSITGYPTVRISSLAEETLQVIENFQPV